MSVPRNSVLRKTADQETADNDLVPLNPASRRLESVDILRGLLMLLMALDHARDFFGSARVDPMDPLHSWPALFFTRWITNLCAPGFIALAGTSVYLQRRRGKTAKQVGKLLLTRGLWLIFLEVTVITFAWGFTAPPFLLQVIWAVGICMICLSGLQWLPVTAVGTLGFCIIAGHNLLDPIDATNAGQSLGWELLHVTGPIFHNGHMLFFELYPLLPWVGVICAGYAFGPLAAAAPVLRQKASAALGILFLGIFSIFRLRQGYGDSFLAEHLPTAEETAMSFFRVQKYPPSLDYVLATFGFLLLLYALFDMAVERQWLPRTRAFVETYGRVPFFYYVLHIYLIHGSALLLTVAEGGDWHYYIGLPMGRHATPPSGSAFSLIGVYLVWAAAVLILYLPCLWFSRFKARRRDWWLSYL